MRTLALRLRSLLPMLPEGVLRVVVDYLPSPQPPVFLAVRVCPQGFPMAPFSVSMPDSRTARVSLAGSDGSSTDFACDAGIRGCCALWRPQRCAH